MTNPLAKLLRRPVWLGAGGLVFAASTLIVIKLLGLSMMIGVLIVLIVLLVVVILMLVRQLQAAKAAEEIETTITRQADRDIERSVAGQAAELEHMKADLLSAIEALKSSKLGRRAGKSALGVLPWYMVVGPIQSGKGVLVQRSGLHFPLTDDSRTPRSVRGVGGTRSLEWWLSEEAVILDMPGRLLKNSEFQDTDDWLAFLNTLKQQRKDKPLNGVLVAVALDQIADKPEPEIDALARRVRERVQELVHHLGVVFPTYVVFTRCDRLAGFAEFFGDLDVAQRKQAWGAAVPTARARVENAAHLFDAEYELLVAAVGERRLSRLADVPDAAQRARVFAFPLQLQRVREPLKRFVRVLFEPDPLEEGPLFRGFYLTSAAPQGEAIDRVLDPEAKALGLVAGGAAAPAMAGNGSWFVHDVFDKVIFPDADLAAESTRANQRRKRGQWALFGVLGIVLFGFTVLFSVLSCANRSVVNRVKKAALTVDQEVGVSVPLIQNLTVLEGLRASAWVVDSLHDRRPLWRTLGAYSGDAVRDPALALHAHKTMETLVGPAVVQIESRLQRMTSTGEGRFLNYYFQFRAWRLLTDPRHLTLADAPLVGAVVAGALYPRVSSNEPLERQRFPQLVERQIAFLARHPEVAARLAPQYLPPPNRELQTRAAARMSSSWDSEQFYRLMVERAREQVPPATFATLVGPPGLLNGTAAVLGPYTLKGWDGQVQPRIKAFRALTQRDWVIDDAFNAAGSPKPDLAGDLERSYARDYTQQWANFLNRLTAPRSGEMGARAAMLAQAAQENSQLFKVLRAARDNTALDVDPGSALSAIQREFSVLQAFFGDGSLGQRGASLLGKVTSFGKKAGPPKAGTPQEKLQVLIRAAQAKADAAAQAGNQITPEQGQEVTTALEQISRYAGELAAQYPGTGAAPTAHVIRLMGSGGGGGDYDPGDDPGSRAIREAISNEWKPQVFDPFAQTLAGKYPFSDSGPDASMGDFKAFFGPGGTFWSFFDAKLKTYMSEDGRPLPSSGTVVTPAMQQLVRRAYDIRQAFFSAGPDPTLQFEVRTNQPTTEGPHVIVYWVAMDLGGQNFSYNMGARSWQALVWPGAEASAGATLRANVRGVAAETVSREGLWGLFHLLDSGRYGTSDDGNPQVWLRLNAGPSKMSFPFEFKPGSAQHPFKPGGMRFELPAKL